MRRGRGRVLTVVWIVVGVIVAAREVYLEALGTNEQIVSALLAVALWPLLFLCVDLHVDV